MRALCAGEDDFRFAGQSGDRRRQAHLQALVSHELLTGAPVDSPGSNRAKAAGQNPPGADATAR